MTKRTSPKAPLITDQWQYWLITIAGDEHTPNPTPEQTQERLTALGSEGWELVAVTSAVAGFSMEGHDESGNHVHTVYPPLPAVAYFKRLIPIA